MLQEEKKTQLKRKILLEYLPMSITGIGILISAIVFKQMVIKVVPLFVSLLVMLLSSRANRFTFLLGAANSVIYIIGYIMEGVYGQVAQAVFGIVMMLIAYFRWKKDAYGKSTHFRSFSIRGKILLTLVICAAWATASFVLWKMNGTAVVFDGLTMVLGFAVNILNVWGFIEVPFINLIASFMQSIMWVQIIFANGNYAAATYFVSNLYNLYMIARTAIKWCSLYKEQQAKKKVQGGADNAN